MRKHVGEIWKAIPGTDAQYSVSSLGRVRSEPMPGRTGRQRGRILQPYPNKKGYLLFRVCLTSGIQWQTRVHQVVAAAFIGPRPDGMQINHKDGDKTNNIPENLEYVTCRQNIRHAWDNGLHGTDHCRGERNNHSRLTADDVRAIRAIYPSQSLGELAGMFGVTKQAISAIVKNKTWCHIN